MNRVSQRLILLAILSLVACQGTIGTDAQKVTQVNPVPLYYDIRDITRTSYHHEFCQCTSPVALEERPPSCVMGNYVPKDCRYTIYSEVDLVERIKGDPKFPRELVDSSIQILNGTLMVKAGEEEVRIVESILGEIRQECSQ